MSTALTALNHHDLRRQAQRFLPRGVFEYVDRGTEDEHALAELVQAWRRWQLLPASLVDVSQRNASTSLFDRPQASPLVIAPTAMAGLLRHDGEVLMAQAAAQAGVPFCVATQSITPIERIAAGAPQADLWFQLYLWEDRTLAHGLVRRAQAAGARVLVLTADTVIAANREYNQRNGFGVPIRPTLRGTCDVLMHPRWLLSCFLRSVLRDGVPTFAHYPPEFRRSITRSAVSDRVNVAESLHWDDVVALRKLWQGPLVIKGVLRPEDARRAADLGVDGVVVSCHGARNVDSAPAAIDMLPAVVDAVGHRMTVLMDSGVRRGSDVAKAVALGAQGVMVGRMPLWGMAAAGATGAAHALDILRQELLGTMALLGCPRLQDLRAALRPDPSRSLELVQP